MTIDKHALSLGKLLGNFQSLEFLLRAFLHQLPTASPSGVPNGTDIYSFPVGTELAVCSLTSYDSLGQLIDKFNSAMEQRGLPGIDRTLVEIRDALAHGRVSASDENMPLRLLKFSKPINGYIRITFNELLTEAWYTAQTKRVYEAIQSVHSRVGP
jgi:hypothetical protein